MASLLILKTGSTYPSVSQKRGDFETWFAGYLEPECQVAIRNVAEGELPESAEGWQGVVVTGSPAMVTDRAAWSEQTAIWLREAVELGIPVLGVCYGHQLLAHAFGGSVGFREQGRESGTFEVRLTDEGKQDPLLGQLPAAFPAHLTHAQSALELPAEATLLAFSEGEAHQAFRMGRHAWGVQFHPEFDQDIMTTYLETQSPALEQEGQDVKKLLSTVRDTPEASSLLARFAHYVNGL